MTGYHYSNGNDSEYGSVTITNCYNMGAVSVSDGYASAGGIVGINTIGRTGCKAEVTNCYSVGTVTAFGSNAFSGGIAGRNSDIVKNCYYDKNLCGDIGAFDGADDTTNSVIGLTTAKMTGTDALSNMTGFDNTVWMTKADGYDDVSGKYFWYYPHLKGFDYDTTQTVADWLAKAETAVTWNEPVSYEYNGSEIKPTVTAVTVGSKALDSSDYTVSYYKKTNDSWSPDTVSPIDAGDYKAVIKFTDSGIGNIEKAFTITKAPLTITANQQDYTYNGAIQGPGDMTYADAAELAEVITVSGLKGNDAVTSIMFDGQGQNKGDYDLVPSGATVNGNSAENNYNVTYVNGVLRINPKTVTIKAKSEEFTYNGTAHSCSLYEVDGLVGDDAISAVVEGSITFPSESPVSNVVKDYEFTSGMPSNYNVSLQNGTLTMRKASAPITITAASQKWTYDGSAHSNSAVTVTNGSLFDGDTLVATATGSVTNVSDTATGNNVIASGYKIMHGDADVTDNYVITAVNGTLTITARPITSDGITVSDINSVIYTGNPYEPVVTVKDGDKELVQDVDYTVSYGNNVDVTDAAEVTIEGIGNYGDSRTVHFSITQKAIEPTVTLEGWTCGSKANAPVVAGNDGNGEVSFFYKEKGSDDSTYTDKVPAKAGDYTVKAEIAETLNYYAGSATADFRISHKDGWDTENGDKYYYTNDKAATEWKQIDGTWYYFGNDGKMQTGWQTIYYNKAYRVYYFDENGKAAQGWKKIDGNWYYFNICARQSGWVKYEGSWYFLDKNGVMKTGWVKNSGEWYYLKSSGAMATGWQYINGNWYFFAASGRMCTGWIHEDGEWYYANSDGTMRTANLNYKGKIYHFNSSGACLNP